MLNRITPDLILPADSAHATLIGRAWVPALGGAPVLIRAASIYDLSGVARTVSELLEMESPVAAIRAVPSLPRIAGLAEVMANCDPLHRDMTQPWLLAPCDLHALKASGVTFIASMLERVIEEQARGDASRAEAVRKAVVEVIGENLTNVRPGSTEAARLKEVLVAQGMWSQYLEVGIGPDAEIFTKSQPLSAVGVGAEVGIHPQSEWNNPEPEIVLAITVRILVCPSYGLRGQVKRVTVDLGHGARPGQSKAVGPVDLQHDLAGPHIGCSWGAHGGPLRLRTGLYPHGGRRGDRPYAAARRIGQPRQPSHGHADIQVLPFYVRGANAVLIRVAGYRSDARGYYRGRSVPRLALPRVPREDFD